MEIIFREYILSHLLKPCIETYFNGKKEFIGQLYGIKNKDRFILEDIFVDLTAKKKIDAVTPIPNKLLQKISQNLEGLTIGSNIGDFHPHIITDKELKKEKVKNKREYIKYIEETCDPKTEDKKSMKRDTEHIYIIITLAEKRYEIKWNYASDKKSILGSTKDLTYHISAWYYNLRKRRDKFDKAKIIARNVLGNQ